MLLQSSRLDFGLGSRIRSLCALRFLNSASHVAPQFSYVGFPHRSTSTSVQRFSRRLYTKDKPSIVGGIEQPISSSQSNQQEVDTLESGANQKALEIEQDSSQASEHSGARSTFEDRLPHSSTFISLLPASELATNTVSEKRLLATKPAPHTTPVRPLKLEQGVTDSPSFAAFEKARESIRQQRIEARFRNKISAGEKLSIRRLVYTQLANNVQEPQNIKLRVRKQSLQLKDRETLRGVYSQHHNLEPTRVKELSGSGGKRHTVVLFPYRSEEQLQADKIKVQEKFVREFPNYLSKMKSWVQILTTPTADTPGTTLVLHFDSRRYIFGNVAEGTQRACVQRKTSLNKIEDIFLTGKVDWANTGGILGMILTLADVKATSEFATGGAKKRLPDGGRIPDKRLTIHGGRNLTHLLATARKFVFRKGLPLDIDEIKENPKSTSDGVIPPTFHDQNIKVWAMAVSPPNQQARTRKRSREAMEGVEANEVEQVSEDHEREEGYDQLRRGVVGHMFDSDWRLDTLVSMKLNDVEMPSAVFVRKDGKIQKYEGPLPGSAESVPDIDVLVRRPWPGSIVDSLPPTTPSQSTVSYIVKNHPQRGKFNVKVAKELKVLVKDYKSLTQGESVVSEDGKTITPDMVLAPGKEGGGFAILEIPDVFYIDAVLGRPELVTKEIMNEVGAIVWILGPGVHLDARLTKYMETSKVEHIVTSTDLCSNQIALESSAAAAIRLNLLDAGRFPLPVHNNAPTMQMEINKAVHVGRAGLRVNLEPKFEITNDYITGYLDTGKVIADTCVEALQLAAEARKTVEDPNYLAKIAKLQEDILCKDAEVIALGTGSSLPSKYRNVSATLLRVPDYGNYLFDCGESTLGQLKRVFGSELNQVLKDLKVIWISHLHADHHLGTASVIRAWKEATASDPLTKDNKLMVASANGMLKWLAEYSLVEDYGYNRILPVNLTASYKPVLRHDMNEYQISAFNLMSIEAVRVTHCHDALAVVFNFPNGFKVAYSGDCRPSTEFAEIGKGATLLIHEATFDDELQGDAFAKKHSTTSEALQVGKDMGARRILLTHFSQRYQKIPVMEGSEGGKDQVAVVAFDYMKVRLDDFKKLIEFRPALLKLYEEKEE